MVLERAITHLGLNESSTKMIEAFSSVIVARGAITGRLAMLGTSIAMNQTCYALSSHFCCYLTLYCQLKHMIEDLVHSAQGLVFDTITTDSFKTHLTLLPAEEIIRRFEVVAYLIFQSILSRQKESSTLAATRDALLPKLLSGELRINGKWEMTP